MAPRHFSLHSPTLVEQAISLADVRVLAVCYLVVGALFLVLGRHIPRAVNWASAFTVGSELVFQTYLAAGVDFSANPAAFAFVVGMGLVMGFLTIGAPLVGRALCGACLGLLLSVAVSQPLVLYEPSWAAQMHLVAIGMILVLTITAIAFNFVAYAGYPSLLGAFLVVEGIDTLLHKLLRPSQVLVPGGVLCSQNNLECWGLYSLWPLLAIFGILFQAATPPEFFEWCFDKLRGWCPWLLGRDGYELIADAEEGGYKVEENEFDIWHKAAKWKKGKR